jgi:biofilm PGA synthesis N-glycosyltransferase PgaC
VKLLFWLSILLIFYTYLLYPAWLFLRSRLYPRAVHRNAILPKISIVMAVRNEEKHVADKIQNLRTLNYPSELMEIIIASDGSTDGTNDILSNLKDSAVHSVFLPMHLGKAEALNRATEVGTGDILLFMDARQRVGVNSIKLLVENFADPTVGCVSGALTLGDKEETSSAGFGWYWEMEKAIRYAESVSGSVVGATGALYAVKRELVPRLPAGLILDDVFIPMEVARRGLRVIFEPRAVVWDNPSKPQKEFHRKVRTLFGNYQLLRMAPWLLSAENPIRFEYISHKLCRLIVPFALIGMILSSFFLSGFIYHIPLAVAIGIGVLGVLGLVRVPLSHLSRLTDVSLAFILLNTAAMVAFFYFSVGKKEVWGR